MKNLIYISSLVFGLNVSAQVNTVDADSKIKEVTVFTSAAQINRSANISLKAGYNRVSLADLSPFINVNSIQVSGFEGITIVSVNHTLDHLADKASDPIFESLLDERNDLIYEREKLRLIQTNLRRERNLIFINKNIKSATKGLIVEDLMDMAEFYQERLTDINANMIAIKLDEKGFTKKINQINQQLNIQKSSKNKSRAVIEVTIKSKKALSGNLIFNYMVRNAGWYPTYDLRSKDLNSGIAFTYKAMVYQKTGNSWENVKLNLSTGDPEKSSNPPELFTWRVAPQTLSYKNQNSYGYQSQQQNVAYEQVSFEDEPVYYTNVNENNIIGDSTYSLSSHSVTGTFSEYGSLSNSTYNWANGTSSVIVQDKNNTSSQTITREDISRMPKRSLKKLASHAAGVQRVRKSKIKRYSSADDTQMQETSVNTVFNISTPYSIPSDGKQYNVEVQNFDVPASYQYYAAPRSENDAFLVAKAANWDDLNILPGNSSIYFQGTFVGEAFINPKVTKDTLELSLGRDKNIVVARKLLKEYSKKISIGSKRKVTKAYEIKVRNNRSKAIEILVVDQIPLSNNKDVEVSITDQGGAKHDEDNGKLSWVLTIPPGESKTLVFKFEVKYPKTFNVSNL